MGVEDFAYLLIPFTIVNAKEDLNRGGLGLRLVAYIVRSLKNGWDNIEP